MTDAVLDPFDEIWFWYVRDDLDARLRAVLWLLPVDVDTSAVQP